MKVLIEKQEYQVEDNEFTKFFIEKYCNLNMFNDLSEMERLVGLISEIANELNIHNTIYLNPTHGGFIPINCSNKINKNVVLFDDDNTNHANNLKTNVANLNINNVSIMKLNEQTNLLLNLNINDGLIIFANELNETIVEQFNENDKIIIIANKNKQSETLYKNIFSLTNTNKSIYVPTTKLYDFYLAFEPFIKIDTTNKTPHEFNYDNLINLCIMVKNGGEQFEQMLRENMSVIDRWTILDTGSTDNTIEIIKKNLIGVKKGNLYQEPFINFRDSRNRLLQLAGDSCKYTLMLDDTYLIKGNLRNFLNTVRSDQLSDSFTLYIKSDDVEYGSNRILKSNRKLKYLYKIHEVIQSENNKNVVVPINDCFIHDCRFDYMEERTMNRKTLDLKLLFEELEENPDDPRTYYYLGQTYNLMGDHQNAFKWMMARVNHKKEGFFQEKVDACFEAARNADFKLNKPWNEVEALYKKTYDLDNERPDALYFLGIHYYLENNMKTAYHYFKKGFEIGYPIHRQYSLKPTLSFHFLPKFLVKLCYMFEDYKTGEECCKLFLQHNKLGDDGYEEIVSWYLIYQKLKICPNKILPMSYNENKHKPRFCFVADGGFEPWTGSTILKKGVGGSETYIIEMARYIQQSGLYEVIVFCNCETSETFEGVTYFPLSEYCLFINTHHVDNCIVSRYSEYLPATFKSHVINVHFVVHDLTPSGIVIPIDPKLKNIFCLTEWHVEYMAERFPSLKHLLTPFYYGIDFLKFNNNKRSEKIIIEKIPHKFIYSSFPNRGLLPLLQMWPLIYNAQPKATLHIFSDVHGKWVNEVQREQMKLIRDLLDEYKTQQNGLNIYYHGWVDKKTLADEWLSADIWFYPCIFMETFCLTALEAATTKTLAITNDLAALQNTVGDRGVVIKGDPMTSIWQQEAVNKVIEYMNISNTNKSELIRKNYEWASTLSWKNQATKLLNNYILPHSLNYAGMYNWTHDLPVGHKMYFLDVIDYFNNNYVTKIKDRKIKVLEIGVYAGTSLINILKLIPNSVGIAIDKWTNYNENSLLNNIEENDIENIFQNNIKKSNMQHRVVAIKGNSFDELIKLYKETAENELFDFIYVDGSHLLLDSYIDIILSWQILNKGGILAIDDVILNNTPDKIMESPFNGVNHFLDTHKGQYKLLHFGYRVFLEKI